MKPPVRAVLFDLDGTLLDTLRDLADSGNAVLERRGHPGHGLDAYRVFVGSGMAHLARSIFPEGRRPNGEAEVAAVLAEYRAAYAERWRNTTRPYPGVAALLDGLRECAVPAAVVSNKAHDFTLRCVEEFLSGWSWASVIGQQTGSAPKPDPAGALQAAAATGVEPASCAFVGDSDVDMLTARNAGMRAVAAGWGFRSAEELRRAGAETVLDRPEELLEWMRGPE